MNGVSWWGGVCPVSVCAYFLFSAFSLVGHPQFGVLRDSLELSVSLSSQRSTAALQCDLREISSLTGSANRLGCQSDAESVGSWGVNSIAENERRTQVLQCQSPHSKVDSGSEASNENTDGLCLQRASCREQSSGSGQKQRCTAKEEMERTSHPLLQQIQLVAVLEGSQ